MSKVIGLTRTSVTNIERGRQKIQLHTLYDLADALGAIVLTGCGEHVSTPVPNQTVPSPGPGGAALAPMAQSASGSLTYNDRTMSIRGAFATWYPCKKSLDIALLPFKPSAKEMQSLAGKSFLFLDDAKNPDPALFKRCPYGILRFQWRQARGTPQLVAADAVTSADGRRPGFVVAV